MIEVKELKDFKGYALVAFDHNGSVRVSTEYENLSIDEQSVLKEILTNFVEYAPQEEVK